MTDTAPSAKPPAPAIYALTVERFRGIATWPPIVTARSGFSRSNSIMVFAIASLLRRSTFVSLSVRIILPPTSRATLCDYTTETAYNSAATT